MKFKHFIFLLFVTNCIFEFTYTYKEQNLNSRSKLKRRAKSSPLTLVNKSTNANDYGHGSIFYLDRHNLNCDIGVLTSFKLKREGKYKYKYDYSCVQPTQCDANCIQEMKKKDAKICKHLTTPPNAIAKDDKKSMNYLDRHNLNCPDGFLMTQFNLKSKHNPNKIYFNYTCCPAKTKDCAQSAMPWRSFGDFSAVVLDNYKVGHLDVKSHAIKQFRLQVDYAKKSYSYKYTSCFIIG